MYWPPLTTKSTKRSENGLIAVNTRDIGFRLSQRMPVMYAIRNACRTGSIILLSAIRVISNAISNKVDKHIIKGHRRDREWKVSLYRKLREISSRRLERKDAQRAGAGVDHRAKGPERV